MSTTHNHNTRFSSSSRDMVTEGKDNEDTIDVENRSDMLFAIHDALIKSAKATSSYVMAEDDTFVDVFGRDLFFILYRFMTGNIMGIGTTHFSVISDATHPFMWRMLLNLRPSETFIDIKGLPLVVYYEGPLSPILNEYSLEMKRF